MTATMPRVSMLAPQGGARRGASPDKDRMPMHLMLSEPSRTRGRWRADVPVEAGRPRIVPVAERPSPHPLAAARFAGPRRLAFVAAMALAALATSPPVRGDILVTAENPGVQQSQVAGVLTMNF